MPNNSLLFKQWLLLRYSGHGLNNGPFYNWTNLDHLKTELVRYLDPHCIYQ